MSTIKFWSTNTSPLCSKCEAVQWTQRPAAPLTSEIGEKTSIKFNFGIKHYKLPNKVIFCSYRTNTKQNQILTIFSVASRWQQQLSKKGRKLPVCTVSHPRGTRILIYAAVRNSPQSGYIEGSHAYPSKSATWSHSEPEKFSPRHFCFQFVST